MAERDPSGASLPSVGGRGLVERCPGRVGRRLRPTGCSENCPRGGNGAAVTGVARGCIAPGISEASTWRGRRGPAAVEHGRSGHPDPSREGYPSRRRRRSGSEESQDEGVHRKRSALGLPAIPAPDRAGWLATRTNNVAVYDGKIKPLPGKSFVGRKGVSPIVTGVLPLAAGRSSSSARGRAAG